MRDIVFIYDIFEKYADLDEIGNKSHHASRIVQLALPRLLKTIAPAMEIRFERLSRFVYRV